MVWDIGCPTLDLGLPRTKGFLGCGILGAESSKIPGKVEWVGPTLLGNASTLHYATPVNPSKGCVSAIKNVISDLAFSSLDKWNIMSQ